MIEGKWFPQGSDLSEVLSIRKSVFSRGEDALDSLAQNVLVYEDGVPVATGRIWWEDGVFWLGDLAVLPAFRNRRLGDLVLRLLLFKAQQHFAREVRLRCPPDVVGFFDRLGLRPADVAPSDELIELWIPGEKIDLDSCKSCRKEGCPNRVP